VAVEMVALQQGLLVLLTQVVAVVVLELALEHQAVQA
jgi:hypothetical protein